MDGRELSELMEDFLGGLSAEETFQMKELHGFLNTIGGWRRGEPGSYWILPMHLCNGF
jgi:hypothetical protein